MVKYRKWILKFYNFFIYIYVFCKTKISIIK